MFEAPKSPEHYDEITKAIRQYYGIEEGIGTFIGVQYDYSLGVARVEQLIHHEIDLDKIRSAEHEGVPVDLDERPRDARAVVSSRVDKDRKFRRSALQLNEHNSASVDVLNKDGSLLCRLNIIGYSAQNQGCVDVIFGAGAHEAEALHWISGVRQVTEIPETSNLVAVVFKTQDPEET